MGMHVKIAQECAAVLDNLGRNVDMLGRHVDQYRRDDMRPFPEKLGSALLYNVASMAAYDGGPDSDANVLTNIWRDLWVTNNGTIDRLVVRGKPADNSLMPHLYEVCMRVSGQCHTDEQTFGMDWKRSFSPEISFDATLDQSGDTPVVTEVAFRTRLVDNATTFVLTTYGITIPSTSLEPMRLGYAEELPAQVRPDVLLPLARRLDQVVHFANKQP